jgi:hypothetical protein
MLHAAPMDQFDKLPGNCQFLLHNIAQLHFFADDFFYRARAT